VIVRFGCSVEEVEHGLDVARSISEVNR
jgi:hypothetical protein